MIIFCLVLKSDHEILLSLVGMVDHYGGQIKYGSHNHIPSHINVLIVSNTRRDRFLLHHTTFSDILYALFILLFNLTVKVVN